MITSTPTNTSIHIRIHWLLAVAFVRLSPRSLRRVGWCIGFCSSFEGFGVRHCGAPNRAIWCSLCAPVNYGNDGRQTYVITRAQ